MVKRKLYLENKPWEEALQGFVTALDDEGALSPRAPEEVSVVQALGRITAEPVFARLSAPHYHAAAMDGVAVRAEATFGTSESQPYRLLLGEQAIEVDTGDPLPRGYNAVIMAEDLHYPGTGEVEIIAPASPWQHVRLMGEDLVATEAVLPVNHRLRPGDIGSLLTAGVTGVLVHPRPRVAILPTGDELVPPGTEVKPGDIIESNGALLASMVAEWGGEAESFSMINDNLEEIEKAVDLAASGFDLVVVNAGSSAGREDFTAAVFSRLGRVLTHGVAIKPGKPVILGIVHGKPVLGVPGYPVSAAIAFELFARPLIYRLQGLIPPSPRMVHATIGRKVASPLGVEEFLHVKLGRVGERLMAAPLSRGAGVTSSLVRADGVLRIPRLSEGFNAGHQVEIELLRTKEEIEKAVVLIGSHDPAIDILGDHLRRLFPGLSISSANVGSLGGLMALRRGEAHGAGIHLLDEKTGHYNVAYLDRYLGQPAVLVNLAYRQQGLMVSPGNPKGIASLADLAREDVCFVNRQAGAGTRLLLDYLLRRDGIGIDCLAGYEREEFTHLAVAVAVAGRTADAGMGILAAARALGLDFIPVAEERYDLCFPYSLWEHQGVQAILSVLRHEAFTRQVTGLGGYDTRECGRVLYKPVALEGD